MVTSKRKRSYDSDDASISSTSGLGHDSEDEVDISSALVGRKPAKTQRRQVASRDEGEGDEELQELIRESISKRDVKGGTDILKKTKGKAKMAKGEVGGGSFQSMGLHPWLLRSLTLQGFRIPTPIQRLSIPALLANPPRDLVGMARTGSGKSLAYMIPLIQRLSGRHSSTFGARALILLPSRELALQVLKVGKELARDSKTDDDGKKGQSLRWSLIVGGEGLDEQFEMITQNPDIIIATPGRLLHLIVEMNMDLKSVQYVVFDEADRLFEMGFETALTEILHRLPPTRQTLLFSATLPRAWSNAESKISPDLKVAFFSVKQAEKDACLLVLLREVIGVPLGSTTSHAEDTDQPADKKGKAKAKHHEQVTAPHQTLVFAATKHHVEYLTTLLTTAGFAVSHIYGTLDQAARSQQMEQFRRGHTSILVVTELPPRYRHPVLENVVNYDFPQGARVFVHRVGRTARAGRQGWAWSFITNADSRNHNLTTLRDVMRKGHSMYEPAKEMTKEGKWGFATTDSGIHPVLLRNKKGELLEIGARGNTETAALMKQRRKALSKAAQRASLASTSAAAMDGGASETGAEGVEWQTKKKSRYVRFDIPSAHFAYLQQQAKGDSKNDFRDSEFYMSHYQKDAHTEKGYSLRDGATFAEQARNVTFDLTGDEGLKDRKRREMHWDKKKKRFIKGSGEGADNVKLVRTESGIKLPATYRSGRFDEWKAKSRVYLPKVGEAEAEGPRRGNFSAGGRKFLHKQVSAPKPLDKLNTDYERKSRQKKKQGQNGGGEGESGPSSKPLPGRKGKALGRRNGGKSVGKVRNELKTVDQIRKSRQDLEKRKTKNARPSRKKGRR
ncbi:P-loop containing nucleoside triphosphate hydrolase protein [Fomitopsis serialis]|uniref:P-loop containing nucleoside triphosphate hydrolase protein n=1 Tax=Fomitopsis serialis TaxID=139415 RepID=UPI0020080A30|nr:P-loop containing nucleoside triphosphate hydrolase protein [Neoantrodia serialis]KAH9935492.1 P-loop containing nucleoside triphosphate hydrolase protein [Neoantrodia serialis]